MNESIMEKFVDCLRNNPNHAFNFICKNGHLFSKDELISIAKELLYAISSNLIQMEHDEILSDAADELNDMIY